MMSIHVSLAGAVLLTQPDDALLERAKAILAEGPLIDGHNDLPTVILDAAQGDVSRFDLRKRQIEFPISRSCGRAGSRLSSGRPS